MLNVASSAPFPNLDSLNALRHSTHYKLSVEGRSIPVLDTWKTTNHGSNGVEQMAFAGFDTDGEVQVSVQVNRPFKSVEIRPRSAKVNLKTEGDQLHLTMKPLEQLTLVFDQHYDQTLVIAANPVEKAPQSSDVSIYYPAGVHQLKDRVKLKSGDRVYLEEGAIVCGAFDIKDAEDVRIYGRGIVYGGDHHHQENFKVFGGSHTKNITIEGITVCNAPGWICSFWNGSENLTVRNVKMVGNFRYNTDGVQTGTKGLLVEHCYLQCNDDNFSLNGICQDVVIRNNVLWNLYNGGVFMLGWATGQHFDLKNLNIHDNTIIRCGGCCDYDRKAPFSMKLFGSHRSAQNIIFKKIVIEDLAPFGRWVDFQAAKATQCNIRDIRFEEIQIDAAWIIEGEIRGMNEQNPIEHVSFKNIRYKDNLIQTPQDGHLSLIHTKGTYINDQVFDDITLPAQSIPTSAGHMATRPVQQAEQNRLNQQPRSTPTPLTTLPVSGINLLANPKFENGLEHWILPGVALANITLNRDDDQAPYLSITQRRRPDVGIEIDVSDILRKHGPGNYTYAVKAKGQKESIHVKVTMQVMDALGTQNHPTPDALVATESWGVATRTQNLQWSALKEARLKIESGYGDKGDLDVSEVYLGFKP